MFLYCRISPYRLRLPLAIAGAIYASAGYSQTASAPTAADGASTRNIGTTPSESVTPSLGTTLRRNPATPIPTPELEARAPLPEQAGFIRAEPLFVYPALGVGVGYNDNLTGSRTSPANGPISSALIWAMTRLRAEAKSGPNIHALTYRGTYAHYLSRSKNDYGDHELVASTNNQFTRRADLSTRAYYLVKRDEGGLVDRPVPGEPERWHAAGADGTIGYGAPAAQGRVEFNTAVTDKKYQNHPETTKAFDVSTYKASGRFRYLIAPKTTLLTEVSHTTYDYRLASSLFDNDEQSCSVGATWGLAAASSGELKFGYLRKSFKFGGIPDYSGSTAELALRWLPRSYSTLNIFMRSEISDSTGTGIFSRDKSVDSVWDHRWTSDFFTRASLRNLRSRFAGISRSDRLGTASASGYFDVRAWLRLGLELSHENRSSSAANAGFARNVVLLSIGGTL